ncbi:hypothetical protein [Halovulum sp. GXIMD14793]
MGFVLAQATYNTAQHLANIVREKIARTKYAYQSVAKYAWSAINRRSYARSSCMVRSQL